MPRYYCGRADCGCNDVEAETCPRLEGTRVHEGKAPQPQQSKAVHKLLRIVVECAEHGETDVDFSLVSTTEGERDGWGASASFGFTCPLCGEYDHVEVT